MGVLSLQKLITASTEGAIQSRYLSTRFPCEVGFFKQCHNARSTCTEVAPTCEKLWLLGCEKKTLAATRHRKRVAKNFHGAAWQRALQLPMWSREITVQTFSLRRDGDMFFYIEFSIQSSLKTVFLDFMLRKNGCVWMFLDRLLAGLMLNLQRYRCETISSTCLWQEEQWEVKVEASMMLLGGHFL